MTSNNFSLFSPKGTGGVTGFRGYIFQDAYILSKLPEWLEDDSFSCVIKEGFEDVDVKYVEGESEKIHCYQVKNHFVDLTEFRDVLNNFYEKSSELKIKSTFILSSPGLKGTCNSIKTKIEDYRELLKIHCKSLTTTKEDLNTSLKKIDINIPLDFLVKNVFFDTNFGPSNNYTRLCDQFVGAILRNEKFKDMRPLVFYSIFNNLFSLFAGETRKVITKEDILKRITQNIASLQQVYKENGITVRLFHWEEEAFNLSQTWDLLLDWSEYFDRSTRTIPNSEIWNTTLVDDLNKAERDIRTSTDSKKIIFYPSACLSAGFLLGSTFKEVKGYSFDIHQRSEIWSSEIGSADNHFVVRHVENNVESNELCVECNISANVHSSVNNFCDKFSMDFSDRLILTSDVGIGKNITNEIALAYSIDLKNILREVVRKNTNLIHLFYAGPLSLSILMGWKFNAINSKIQCYEHINNSYIPTCLIDAS